VSQIGDGPSEVKNPQVPLSAQSLKITTAESLPITTGKNPLPNAASLATMFLN
jgi:hypothetical protein